MSHKEAYDFLLNIGFKEYKTLDECLLLELPKGPLKKKFAYYKHSLTLEYSMYSEFSSYKRYLDIITADKKSIVAFIKKHEGSIKITAYDRNDKFNKLK